MEMPIDIITKHTGLGVHSGPDGLTDNQRAMNIDLELQRKFLSIPFEEIDAVEIEEVRGRLHAGSGPEHCAAGENENPNWLYNHALNALALWWRIKNDEEDRKRLAEEERLEEERRITLARRPKPGVYKLWTGGEQHVAVVTADQRILSVKPHGKHADFTDIFDGMERKERWVFTPIETGLGA